LGYLAAKNSLFNYRIIIHKITSIILITGVVALILSFTIRKYFAAFTVPDYYHEAWKYISTENPARILLLPGLSGVQPTFGLEMDKYHGFDFLYKIWDISVVHPDFSDYTPAYQLKNVINKLVIGILEGKDTCELFRQSGISHILIRQDLSQDAYFELKTADYIKAVKSSRNVAHLNNFGKRGNGLDVYTVKPECRNPEISVVSDLMNMNYKVISVSNTKKIISIPSIKSDSSVKFLNNYSIWWKLIPGDLIEFSWWQDMFLLFKPGVFGQPHEKAFGWANEWKLKSDSHISKYTLYYLPQSAVYLGILFWIILIIIFLVYRIYKLIKK
jgi:hypothetical protein